MTNEEIANAARNIVLNTFLTEWDNSAEVHEIADDLIFERHQNEGTIVVVKDTFNNIELPILGSIIEGLHCEIVKKFGGTLHKDYGEAS